MFNKFKLAKSLVLLAFLGSFSACEVVELDSAGNPIIPMSKEEAAQITNMEPKAIAIKLWPQVEAEFANKTTPLKDLDSGSDSSDFVSFDAVVINFKQSALGNTLTVLAADLIIPLQLGPRVKGNAIRDSLSFVKFDQFKNQVQFAKFSQELNKRAVSSLDSPDQGWVNEQVSVVAAITMKGGKVVSAVPLELARK